MMKKAGKELLRVIAKCSNPQIVIDIPGCPCIFHQPKRPDSLRKDVICKKESK